MSKTAKTKPKNKGGRPKFVINYDTVEKLASIMATQEEIATFLGCHRDTLLKDSKFTDIYKKGLETGKMSLRRIQWKLAEKNTAMAIWLGKQYLGQREPEQDNQDVLNKLDELLEKQTNA